MLSKKKMRNIMINRIDLTLMKYYKELSFDSMGVTPEEKSLNGEIHNNYKEEAMALIDLMKELELVNPSEYIVLRDVYGEYFSLEQ